MHKIRQRTWMLAMVMLLTIISPNQTIYGATVPVQGKKPIVIVLDPGHGGYDGGACKRWGSKNYYEKNMNLTIAKACKEALEQYSGVKVYMTRFSDRYVSLGKRTSFAKQKKADLFVCLHNNAAEKSGAHGACVFYPNKGLNAKVGKSGKELATCIQKRLVNNCGLKNNGIQYRNSRTDRYRDRSTADYYQVIRSSKMAGIPAVIVEHAFITNASDCKRFLGSDAKLRKLGRADAAGIADYFGLVKVSKPKLKSKVSSKDGKVTISWGSGSSVGKKILYRRQKGQKKFSKVKTISNSGKKSYTDKKTVPGETYEYCMAVVYQGKHGYAYTICSRILEVKVPGSKPEQPDESGQPGESGQPDGTGQPGESVQPGENGQPDENVQPGENGQPDGTAQLGENSQQDAAMN